jgi:two-component system cell cycle sensor histidine kinase/response regulator CckA
VLPAPNGVEALRISRDHVGTIDLVVTDVAMPQMAGQVLVEKLKHERPSIRAIFISGYPSGETLAPGTTFVTKPFTTTELLDTIRHVLATK